MLIDSVKINPPYVAYISTARSINYPSVYLAGHAGWRCTAEPIPCRRDAYIQPFQNELLLLHVNDKFNEFRRTNWLRTALLPEKIREFLRYVEY